MDSALVILFTMMWSLILLYHISCLSKQIKDKGYPIVLRVYMPPLDINGNLSIEFHEVRAELQADGEWKVGGSLDVRSTPIDEVG